MGTGKTSWAIQYMNEHKDQRFLYITPYIKEAERIKRACKGFVTPKDQNKNGAKIPKAPQFQNYLSKGKNVAITHELFKRCKVTPEILDNIRNYGYVLVVDEVLDVVQKLNITKKDLEVILEKYATVDKETNVVTWTDDDYPESGDHANWMYTLKTRTVIKYGDNMLLWLFPSALLQAFDTIFIMTYLFHGSVMEQYIKVNGMNYSIYHVTRRESETGFYYSLDKGEQDTTEQKKAFRELIAIYDGVLNNYGDLNGKYNYSFWNGLGNSRNDRRTRKAILENANKFITDYCGLSTTKDSKRIMWTCYKDKLKTMATLQRRFLSFNTRATNEWSKSNCLVYLVNVNPDPNIVRWFKEHGGNIDKDLYALSLMIQWVWRSAIRNGEPIQLYIPSKRMRDMFKRWLEYPECTAIQA